MKEKNSVQRPEGVAEGVAASSVQGAMRGRAARMDINAMKERHDALIRRNKENLLETERIQGYIKATEARKEVQRRIKEKVEEEREQEERLEKEKAECLNASASRVQGVMRGKGSRNSVSHLRQEQAIIAEKEAAVREEAGLVLGDVKARIAKGKADRLAEFEAATVAQQHAEDLEKEAERLKAVIAQAEAARAVRYEDNRKKKSASAIQSGIQGRKVRIETRKEREMKSARLVEEMSLRREEGAWGGYDTSGLKGYCKRLFLGGEYEDSSRRLDRFELEERLNYSGLGLDSFKVDPIP